MKSEIVSTCETIDNSPQFPCIARGTCVKESVPKDVYVLFTSEQCGTVIHSKDIKKFPIGEYSDNWIPVSSKKHWIMFPPGTNIEIRYTT